MDLLQHLRSERAERRRKQSLAPTLFDRINGLVKAYALGDTFLRNLEASAGPRWEEDLRFDRLKPKPPYEPPLFSLSTQEEYRVTMAIITRVANTYLNFVSSPDEVLLCGPLFRQNPVLPAERLARFHFEGLLLAEVAKRQIQRLTEQIHRLEGRQGLGTMDRPRLSLLQARLDGLRRFVAGLEEAGGR